MLAESVMIRAATCGTAGNGVAGVGGAGVGAREHANRIAANAAKAVRRASCVITQ
jgi:hypothetical protein